MRRRLLAFGLSDLIPDFLWSAERTEARAFANLCCPEDEEFAFTDVTLSPVRIMSKGTIAAYDVRFPEPFWSTR